VTNKDGVQIEKDVNANKYSMTIPKVNSSIHSGVVTIKATNPLGSVTHDCNLSVLDSPKFISKLENITINEGQNAEFICKYISNPKPILIAWIKNETEEIVVNETTEIVNEENISILRLINCKSTDTGTNIQVKISNDLGEATSNKAVLNVSCGPVFSQESTDQSVLRDKEARFESIIMSNPKPTVSWLINGKEVTSRDAAKVEKDVAKDKYTLIIPKTTAASTITVKASNEFGTIEKSVQLDVLDAPKALNKLENLTVVEGEPAKFSLRFAGKPKPAVKWFKEEIEIVYTENVEIIEVAEDEVTLVLKSTSASDSGNFFAKISNEFGEVSSNKATLTINRKLEIIF
jgi:hypothetical protein